MPTFQAPLFVVGSASKKIGWKIVAFGGAPNRSVSPNSPTSNCSLRMDHISEPQLCVHWELINGLRWFKLVVCLLDFTMIFKYRYIWKQPFRVISQVSLRAQASTVEETGCNPYLCHQLLCCIPVGQKMYLNQMLTVSGYDTLYHKLCSSAANSGSVSMDPKQKAVFCLNSLEENIAVCSEKIFPPPSLWKKKWLCL